MKVKEMTFGRGLSFEIGGNWHKLYSEMTVELEEGEDIDDAKEMTIDTVDNILKEKFGKIDQAFKESQK